MGGSLVTILTFCFLGAGDIKQCDLSDRLSPGLAHFENLLIPRDAMTREAVGKHFCKALSSRVDDRLILRIAGRGKGQGENWRLEWGDIRDPGPALSLDDLGLALGLCREQNPALKNVSLRLDFTVRGGNPPGGRRPLGMLKAFSGFREVISDHTYTDVAEMMEWELKYNLPKRDVSDLAAYEISSRDFPQCDKLWSGLMAFDLKTLVRDELSGLPSPSGCRPPEELAETHQEYVKACDEFQTTRPLPAQEDFWCRRSALGYRASLREWMTRGTPLAKIQDADTLREKFYWIGTSSPRRHPDRRARERAIVERIVALEPRNPSMLTLRLNYAVEEAERTKEWSQAEKMADELLALHTPSASLWKDVAFYAKTRGMNPARLRVVVKEFQKAGRLDAGDAGYYLAFADLSSGNAKKARARLLNVLLTHPENSLAKGAYFDDRWPAGTVAVHSHPLLTLQELYGESVK